MSKETKKRFNIDFEELIGLLIQIQIIILLKFGNEPQRVGLKDISNLLELDLKVTNESSAFHENLQFYYEILEVFKKSFDAYYIMAKMLAFELIPFEINQKLQQFIRRARFIVKQLMEDYRIQDELLNKEFQKEKMIIESMLIRGDDLANYKYRSIVTFDPPSKHKSKSNKRLEKFLSQVELVETNMQKYVQQQCILYAKKLKRIQNEQQIKIMNEDMKRQIKEIQEKEEKQKNQQIICNKPIQPNSINSHLAQPLGVIFKGKYSQTANSKIKTQPQFFGDDTINLKTQIKEIMKYTRGGKRKNQTIVDKEHTMDTGSFPQKQEQAPWISNETRKYIMDSLTKNKFRQAGALNPIQIARSIQLQSDLDEQDRKIEQLKVLRKYIPLEPTSNTSKKALVDMEKAVKYGLKNCKEDQKLQSMRQSLREIIKITHPQEDKKLKKKK